MATATPRSLLLLPPLTPATRPNRSIPALKLPDSALQSNDLRWSWRLPPLPHKSRLERSPVPIRAATGEISPGQMSVEKAQKIASAASDDGIVTTIVAVLLSIAFVGLCILTIGVIYLGVEDFLQKRNREKFEKEEAERKKREKKGRKKRVLRGPRSVLLRGLNDDDDD